MKQSTREQIDTKMMNILEGHIAYQTPQDYSGAFTSRNGERGLVILDLTKPDQRAMFTVYQDYMKYKNLKQNSERDRECL